MRIKKIIKDKYQVAKEYVSDNKESIILGACLGSVTAIACVITSAISRVDGYNDGYAEGHSVGYDKHMRRLTEIVEHDEANGGNLRNHMAYSTGRYYLGVSDGNKESK